MNEPAESAPRSVLKKRLSLAVLLVIIFGAPALVNYSWITQDVVGHPTNGAQPGGTVTGRVVDADGNALPGQTVELALVSAEGEPAPGPRATTDADGRFELDAPPHEGHYRLRTGGGLWQRTSHGFSFFDRWEHAIEHDPFELVLEPGASLELRFVHADGSSAGDGRFVIDGEHGEGPLFGLVPYGLHHEGRIEAGVLWLDGIPPMQAELFATFDGGESVTLELVIEAGPNARTVEL